MDLLGGGLSCHEAGVTRSPRLLFVALALAAAACKKPPSAPRTLTIVASGDIRGVVEPCGCTSDVLGDVSRIRTLAKQHLWVDAGNLLYDPETYKGERQFQAEVKARCLAQLVGPAEVAAGANDLAGPIPDGLRLHAANVTAPWVKPPTVRMIGDVRVGVVGLVAPGPLPGGLVAADPAPALGKAVAQLRGAKPDLIVALLAMPRAAARQLVAAVPGVDVAIFSVGVEEGLREPEAVASKQGTTYLVAPADEGRRVARLTVTLQGGTLQLFADDAGRAAQRRRLEPRLKKARDRLTELRATAGADPEFIQTTRDDLQKLEAQAQKLAQASAPPTTSYFTYELVPVRRTVPRDPEGEPFIKQSDQTIGAANLERAKQTAPPAAEPGKSTYVGDTACKSCHVTQADFWQTTKHASAWRTLTGVGKQYDYDCIGCHVSGWQQPGGAHLASVEKLGLVDVQCEVCHGPGSAHLTAELEDRKKTITRRPADALCASSCHVKEHSDTFERAAYLRDVTGKGHGEAFRKTLGEGPTGHELRAAAVAKAQAAAQAQAP